MEPQRPMNDRERVEVMLSVLPWLAARGGATLQETALTFGVDPEHLRSDLLEVFYNVEPTVGADSMVEVHIDDDDDYVSVRLPGSFEEPPELDHAEALALLAASVALLGHPGTDRALGTAVDKLQDALGIKDPSAFQIDLGGGDPGVRRLLAEAIEAGVRVELQYFSWSTDEVGRRQVDPWALRSIEGHWYLTGWCHDREGVRHFRTDRVLGAEMTTEPVIREAPPLPQRPVGATTAQRTVTVELAATEAWVVDSLPTTSFEDRGETVRVGLEVLSQGWLDRLLLTLGERATVIDDDGTDLAPRRRQVARGILERVYTPGTG